MTSADTSLASRMGAPTFLVKQVPPHLQHLDTLSALTTRPEIQAVDTSSNANTTINNTKPNYALYKRPQQAFAKLQLPNSKVFYITKSSTVIGRKNAVGKYDHLFTNSSDNTENEENDNVGSGDSSGVDVDLGVGKYISRKHAVIYWDFTYGKFFLSVLGKNGVWIDGRQIPKGSLVELRDKTIITIGFFSMKLFLPDINPCTKLEHLESVVFVNGGVTPAAMPVEAAQVQKPEGQEGEKGQEGQEGQTEQRPEQSSPAPIPTPTAPKRKNYIPLLMDLFSEKAQWALEEMVTIIPQKFDGFHPEDQRWQHALRYALTLSPKLFRFEEPHWMRVVEKPETENIETGDKMDIDA